MRRAGVMCLVLFVLANACQTTPGAAPADATPAVRQPAAPPPNASYVPSGSVLTVSLNEQLRRGEAKVGDAFTVALQEALVAANRDTVIAAGAVITGLVTGVGNAGEQAAIRLNFTRIAIDEVSHPFTAQITATQLPNQSASTAAVDAATAPGAVIGEGELRTTLVKGPLGAGAGTILSLGIGPDQTLPPGTQFTVQTVDRIDLSGR